MASLRPDLLREILGPRNALQRLGLAVVVVVAVTLALPAQSTIAWWAWVPVCVGGLIFALAEQPPLRSFLDRAGGVVVTFLVALLVAATGGAASAYQDLYMGVLVFDGAVRPGRRLLVDAVAVTVAVAAPAVYGDVAPWYAGDALADLALWLGVALLIHAMTGRAVGIARDLTGLRAAVDGVTDAVTLIDLDRERYVYANRAAAAMAGVPPEALLERGINERHPWLDPVTVRRLDQGEVVATEVELPTRGDEADDEATRIIEVVLTPVATGSTHRVVSVGRDVTERRRAERTHGQLAAIVESTDVAVVGISLDRTIETWNPAAERLFGWSRDDALGRSVDILVPIDDIDWSRRQIDVIRAGASVRVESRRLHRDGSAIDVEMDLSPVRDGDGNVVGASSLYRDLRERRAFQRAVAKWEHRLQTFGELADGIVYRIGLVPEPHVQYVSPAIEPMTGFTVEEYRSDPRLPLHRAHPDDRSVVAEPRRPGTGEATGRVLYRFERKDGRWIWLEDHYRLEIGEDGTPTAVQGIAFDVSARQELEATRQRALERERRAAERLSDTIRMQQTFLQAVSHELRTPLTSVLGFAETLGKHRHLMSDDEVDRLVGRLEHNAVRLERLLADLVDVDRLGRGIVEPQLSTVDLESLCRRVLDEVDLQDHVVVLDLADAPSIRADAARIERVVDNLVRNAIKYTPAGTTVRVWLESAERHVVLVVEDDGPGLPDELLDSAFEPFRQGPDAADSPSPGTGVGLSIVSQFARLHGGRAWYEPREGGGASFRVLLPRARARPARPVLAARSD